VPILKIVNCLDPVLRKACKEIENIDGELSTLSQDMIETMYAAPGAGLAANQVGVSFQIIVVDRGIGTEKKDPITIINPKITAMEEEQIGEEGCLSIPDIFAEIKRANRVEMKGVDLDGNDVRLESEGYLARALQHEMDHLEGILFWDKLSQVKRGILKRRFKKRLKEMKGDSK
jgi:peptide deformylase